MIYHNFQQQQQLRKHSVALHFTFVLLVPPRINRQGINFHQRVLVNSSITLPCPASGVPPPTINWFKDNNPVDMKAGIIERRSNGTELVILQASLVDTGRYRCEVFNQGGDDSISFNLNVQGEDFSFICMIKSFTSC